MATVNNTLIVTMLFYLMVLAMGVTNNVVKKTSKEWCVADDKASDDDLQQALNWVCGQDASVCSTIQDGGSCYSPNTLKDHSSVAFNSYWQKNKNNGGTCSFNSVAKITNADPSSGSCKYDFNG